MWTLAIASSLLGCTSLDPETRAATEYVTAVQPLMVENGLLSERLLTMASTVHDASAPNDGLGDRWNQEIAPLALHLQNQTENVEVPTEWQDMHTSLVVIWTDRATAYRAMGEALISADRKQWKEARNLGGSVVKREENWFLETNKRLAPHDLILPQHP